WLPHERLMVKGEPRPVIGYVLSDGGGWVTVLTSGARKVARYKPERVDARTACRGSDFHESAIEWVARHSGRGVTYLRRCTESH
ncbi:MAG TPA: hypothetical protein VKJ07_19440, partial [Mycobacteriales bacterium]|nr:hypothetical protein [Mycobacteriales bacterium]